MDNGKNDPTVAKDPRDIEFDFTVEKMDYFVAQQLLEIIVSYVESHNLFMGGGFHEVKEPSDEENA